MHNLGNNDTQAGTSPGRNYVSAFPLLLAGNGTQNTRSTAGRKSCRRIELSRGFY